MKPSTRSNTKTSSSKPACTTPEPKTPQPSPSSNPKQSNHDHNRSPPEVESKKRRLNKGKNKAIVEEEKVEEVQEIVTRDGVKRTLFRQYMPNTTSMELDRVRLTKEKRVFVHRVFGYAIHGGRSYPKKWYEKYEALRFFGDFLKFQEWEKISEFSGLAYPIEVIQFYASVSIKNGVLIAVVNGSEVKVSIDDFCALFSVPDDGVEINPSAEWGSITEDKKLVIKKYFDVDATGTSKLLTGPFSPKLKFMLNFLWNTIVPRRGGRDNLSSYEMVIVYRWLEGHKVNLPLIVFHRIIQTGIQVTEDKFYSTIDLPYGIWISRVLEAKNVVYPESYGVLVKDEMSDTHLKLMKISALGHDLVFQTKGGTDEKSKVFVAMERKLDAFMAAMTEKLDAQTKIIEDLVKGMAKEKGVAGSSGCVSNEEVMAYMRGLEAKLKMVDRAADKTMHEALHQTTTVANLASQGGALLRVGREMREEMGKNFEATRALSLKVLNFDMCLNAQAAHVRSCFDRLDTLEFRTQPVYVNANTVRHP